MTTDNTSFDINIDTKNGRIDIASDAPFTLNATATGTTMQADATPNTPEQPAGLPEGTPATDVPAAVHQPIDETVVNAAPMAEALGTADDQAQGYIQVKTDDAPVATETAPAPTAEVLTEQAAEPAAPDAIQLAEDDKTVVAKIPETVGGMLVNNAREQARQRQGKGPTPPKADKPKAIATDVPAAPRIKTPLGYFQDGVDHVNVGTGATTSLGQRLSLGHAQQFVIESDGPFLTIAGYWFYLLSEDQDNQFRDKNEGQVFNLKNKKRLKFNVPGFQEKIAKAYWDKINQVPGLRGAIMGNKLPFDAYYIFGEYNPKFENAQHTIEDRSAKWIVPFFEEVRKALRERREPDYSCVRESLEAPARGAPSGREGRAPSQSERQASATWEKAGIGKVREQLRTENKGSQDRIGRRQR